MSPPCSDSQRSQAIPLGTPSAGRPRPRRRVGELLRSGPRVDDHLFGQRFDVCLACEHNAADPRIPKAIRCQLVPCGGWLGAILRLAHGRCPLDKWPEAISEEKAEG